MFPRLGHASNRWEEARLRLMAPFNLRKAVAATQRREGAKSQGFRFLGSFARQRDRIMQREEKPGQIPMILSCHDSVFLVAAMPHCVLASLRLCVNCLCWVPAYSPE